MKKTNVVVGLGFMARAGKGVVADYLVINHGFQKISFAAALKRGCMEVFGFTEEQVYGSLKETVDDYWGHTPRYILQKVGTDLFRENFDPNIWVKAVEKKITANSNVNWVVDDVRFPNEAAAIKKWGGLVVRVDRPQAGASGGIAGHASETAMESYDGWDYIINNQGKSLEKLYEKIEEFVSWTKSK